MTAPREQVRKIVQYIMAKGCVEANEFEGFLNSLRQDNSSQLDADKIFEAIQRVNKKIVRFNMRIRPVVDESSHKKYYTLISTVDSDITKAAVNHTQREFELFRLIFADLKENEAQEVAVLVRLAEQVKFTRAECNRLMESWSNKHWLVMKEGLVRLGPRASAELDVLMTS